MPVPGSLAQTKETRSLLGPRKHVGMCPLVHRYSDLILWEFANLCKQVSCFARAYPGMSSHCPYVGPTRVSACVVCVCVCVVCACARTCVCVCVCGVCVVCVCARTCMCVCVWCVCVHARLCMCVVCVCLIVSTESSQTNKQ